jgi:hypothetical protein
VSARADRGYESVALVTGAMVEGAADYFFGRAFGESVLA